MVCLSVENWDCSTPQEFRKLTISASSGGELIAAALKRAIELMVSCVPFLLL